MLFYLFLLTKLQIPKLRETYLENMLTIRNYSNTILYLWMGLRVRIDKEIIKIIQRL